MENLVEHEITILIADDHPIVRDGLVAILGTQPDFEIVGTADDYIEAWRRAALLRRADQHLFFVMSTETREDPKRVPVEERVQHRPER